MKFILTPVDFSDITTPVVDEAVKLAASIAARIILLHVVQPPKRTGPAADLRKHAELVTEMEEIAERRLAQLKASILRQGVDAHSLRLTGNPAADIVEQARKVNATCVVIGSHGHAAISDLSIGATVSAVLKRADCPLVVVPRERCASQRTGTILVPVDFSRTTIAVVAFAAELARSTQARIVLLKVTHPAVMLNDRARLEQLGERVFVRDGSNPEAQNPKNVALLVLLGKAASVVLDEARRLAVDHIVMGARRPRHFRTGKIGRTAESVIREAPCPVILVPPDKLRKRTRSSTEPSAMNLATNHWS